MCRAIYPCSCHRIIAISCSTRSILPIHAIQIYIIQPIRVQLAFQVELYTMALMANLLVPYTSMVKRWAPTWKVSQLCSIHFRNHSLLIHNLCLFIGLKNWCALPSRCIDLPTGGRISGTGGCPVVAQNSPGTPLRAISTTIRVNGGSTTARSDPGAIAAGNNDGSTIARQSASSAMLATSSSVMSSGANRDTSAVRPGSESTGSSSNRAATVPARIGKQTFVSPL